MFTQPATLRSAAVSRRVEPARRAARSCGEALCAMIVLLACAGQLNAQQQPVTPPVSQTCVESSLPALPEGDPQIRGSQGGTTSDKLAQSGGVICPPPATGQDIRLPTPDAGRTPVITPPPAGEGTAPRPQ